jgi:hypothetical protein
VVGLCTDFGFFTGLWRGFSVGQSHFNLPQQRHDLLRLVFPDRHTSLLQSEFSLTPVGTRNPGQVTCYFGGEFIALSGKGGDTPLYPYLLAREEYC